LGYFVLDNASNNDRAMVELGQIFDFSGPSFRCRCFGHTLNLAAKALLFGNNTEALDDVVAYTPRLSEAEFEIWRKRGPVGKLHNLVTEVGMADRLWNLLRKLQNDDILREGRTTFNSHQVLNLVTDNDTRWLSQLYMIRRALKLRSYLDLLISHFRVEWENEKRSKRTGMVLKSAKRPRILEPENHLTDNDWIVFGHFEDLLSSFEDTLKILEGDGQIRLRTKGFEGSYGNVWQVLHGFEFLLGRLEEYKQVASDFPDPAQFQISVNLAWSKLNDYYMKLDETPVYYAALALHPTYRWKAIEKLWSGHKDSRQWLDKAKHLLQEAWRGKYQYLELPEESIPAPQAKRHCKGLNAFERFTQSTRTADEVATEDEAKSSADEYTQWLSTPESADSDVEDPIQYWHAHRHRYPRLSRMALDFLTVQAMSAECERLFSAGGRMVTPQRNSLDAEIISMSLVLRSWYRSGIIHDVDPVFLSVTEEDKLKTVAAMSEHDMAKYAPAWLAQSEAVDDLAEQCAPTPESRP
jgi:hypothetical protein